MRIQRGIQRGDAHGRSSFGFPRCPHGVSTSMPRRHRQAPTTRSRPRTGRSADRLVLAKPARTCHTPQPGCQHPALPGLPRPHRRPVRDRLPSPPVYRLHPPASGLDRPHAAAGCAPDRRAPAAPGRQRAARARSPLAVPPFRPCAAMDRRCSHQCCTPSSPAAARLALPLARALGLRMVVTLHGGDVSKQKNWRGTVLAQRWPACCGRAARFVCVSAAVAEIAAARGVPPDKLTVLPIGVEVPDRSARPPPGQPHLFVGRFVEKKGIAVLADAMRRLRARGDQTPVICVGDGPLRPVLEALARDVPGITLTGWLPPEAVRDTWREAVSLVVPSIIAARRRRRGSAQRHPGGDGPGLPGHRLGPGRHRRGDPARATPGCWSRPETPTPWLTPCTGLSCDPGLGETLGSAGYARVSRAPERPGPVGEAGDAAAVAMIRLRLSLDAGEPGVATGRRRVRSVDQPWRHFMRGFFLLIT